MVSDITPIDTNLVGEFGQLVAVLDSGKGDSIERMFVFHYTEDYIEEQCEKSMGFLL